MKHYVLGFVFNVSRNKVLLIEKRKPEWQAGHWNGIGGKIEPNDDSPMSAICRECVEEIGEAYDWTHCVTFVCPGGTVFVYRAITNTEEIMFEQLEIEQLKDFWLTELPENMMANLRWLIPICLSTIQFPLIVQQNALGVE